MCKYGGGALVTKYNGGALVTFWQPWFKQEMGNRAPSNGNRQDKLGAVGIVSLVLTQRSNKKISHMATLAQTGNGR